MAQNLILASPNYIDATFYPVSFSGGGWQSALPLSNLADPILIRKARSLSAALSDTQFVVDLGTLRDIHAIAIPGGLGESYGLIPNHNFSRQAMIKVSASTLPDFSVLAYETDFLAVWKEIYALPSLPFEHPSFFYGTATEEEATKFKPPFHIFLQTAVVARYWKFEIDDQENPAGYVEMSRLVLAPGVQPSRNCIYGATIGWEDDTLVQKTLGGGRFYAPGGKRRIVRLRIDYLPRDEGFSQMFDLIREQGINKQIYFSLDPGDDLNLHRQSFLMTLRELNPLEFTAFGLTSQEIVGEEVIA